MTSRIDPTTIDATYPIAGQDNDTAGFHNNYLAVQNNFLFAQSEITALQANTMPVLAPIYTGNLSAGNLTVSGNITAANLRVTSLSYVNQEIINTTDFITANATIGGSAIVTNITSPAGTGGNITIDPDGFGDVVLPSQTELYIYSTAAAAVVISGGVKIYGALNIGNVGDVSANIGVLYSGNVSTQANLGAYQTYANTTNATTQANIGLLYSGNITTQANLGAYQTYANANAATQQTQINSLATNANANVAAYLTTSTGNIAAGNTVITGTLTVSSTIQFANLTTSQINAITTLAEV